jgi:hypothetical protein
MSDNAAKIVFLLQKPLRRFKGIDFLTEHYDAEHLLSFDDSVQGLTQVCLNNGGGIV